MDNKNRTHIALAGAFCIGWLALYAVGWTGGGLLEILLLALVAAGALCGIEYWLNRDQRK